MMWKPKLLSTGSEISPGLIRNATCSNGLTITPRRNQPSSPPISRDPLSSEKRRAAAADSPPPPMAPPQHCPLFRASAPLHRSVAGALGGGTPLGLWPQRLVLAHLRQDLLAQGGAACRIGWPRLALCLSGHEQLLHLRLKNRLAADDRHDAVERDGPRPSLAPPAPQAPPLTRRDSEGQQRRTGRHHPRPQRSERPPQHP